jgi:hypothetical protein
MALASLAFLGTAQGPQPAVKSEQPAHASGRILIRDRSRTADRPKTSLESQPEPVAPDWLVTREYPRTGAKTRENADCRGEHIRGCSWDSGSHRDCSRRLAVLLRPLSMGRAATGFDRGCSPAHICASRRGTATDRSGGMRSFLRSARRTDGRFVIPPSGTRMGSGCQPPTPALSAWPVPVRV